MTITGMIVCMALVAESTQSTVTQAAPTNASEAVTTSTGFGVERRVGLGQGAPGESHSSWSACARVGLECANTYLDCELMDSDWDAEMMAVDIAEADSWDRGSCQSPSACLDRYLTCMGTCASEADLNVRMRLQSCS